MSGSHFGSGYWPEDYFGLYFQPDAGGVIVGALSGSFTGSAAFSGVLSAQEDLGGTPVKKWRRGRRDRYLWEIERDRELAALREHAIAAIANKERAFAKGPPQDLLGEVLKRGADKYDLPQPFDFGGVERLAQLAAMAEKISFILALAEIEAENDDDEEILLLVA